MDLILSICIPNYERPDFLSQTLDSIGKQMTDQIELVVSDDSSQANIRKVIDEFKEKYPNARLIFKSQKRRLGFDKNVIDTVCLAGGEFCWLLSNDDKILPSSISTVLNIIKSNPNLALLLINYRRFDRILNKTTSSRMIKLDKKLKFNNHDEFFFYPTPDSYFKYLGVNTLTMSVDIFRRKYWNNELNKIKPYMGHNFIHVFIIASMVKEHPEVIYHNTPLVQYLANNHRTWSNNIWKDYNEILLPFMEHEGYDSNKIRTLRKYQKRYEKRNQFASQPLVKKIYQLFLKLKVSLNAR